MELDPALKALVAKAPRWAPMESPLPPERMPRHVAIIMDGNGRWATRQGLIRVNGHRMGVDSVRAATRYCGQVRIQALTLYAFSTENWKRPKSEINFLFRLLKKYLVEERAELIANGVRLTTIGSIEALPAAVQEELQRTKDLTAAGSRLNLCLALNYGAQDEILSAARKTLQKVAAGKLAPEQAGAAQLETELFTAGMPKLDLLIRTAGERRLSNFLLWQAGGAHFHVTPVCWPDFTEKELAAAVQDYGRAAACA
ncbi:MAG TPA: polyprenyl diphosphate synthase [Planctomycetota bacterium]|nr:polyprenyl diphosphate synthase [Planctomycetota bacterium]